MNNAELLNALNDNLSVDVDDVISDLRGPRTEEVDLHGEAYRSETYTAEFRGHPIKIIFRHYYDKPLASVELQVTEEDPEANIGVGHLEQDELTSIQSFQWRKLDQRWEV